MKPTLFVMTAMLLFGISAVPQQADAQDDPQFATPAVVDATPAITSQSASCEAGVCRTHGFARTGVACHRRCRPVVRWFQERQPVRSVLRGVVRLIRPRRCR